MKILVVDDSTINNILLQNYLEENNFEVVTALNGPDALEIIRKEPIDLVLLDVMMPEFSGFDFLKHLKTYNLSVPVIIITANADVEYKDKSFELGAKDYLNKPIQFIELKDKINRVLQLA
ncbi:MAG: response regulator [Bacteroidetes bacterium]|nr:response regulator [Bacteroidota bacterium]